MLTNMCTGRLIRLHRERQGRTQLEVAVAAGVTPATIVRVETGRHEPTLATLRKLAGALGVTVGELLED